MRFLLLPNYFFTFFLSYTLKIYSIPILIFSLYLTNQVSSQFRTLYISAIKMLTAKTTFAHTAGSVAPFTDWLTRFSSHFGGNCGFAATPSVAVVPDVACTRTAASSINASLASPPPFADVVPDATPTRIPPTELIVVLLHCRQRCPQLLPYLWYCPQYWQKQSQYLVKHLLLIPPLLLLLLLNT